MKGHRGRPGRVQRKRRREAQWDEVETWMVRCAVAVFIGVLFGLFLVWLRGQS